MTALEEYDPDFSLTLSECHDKEEASRLLDSWFQRRTNVLRKTQARLEEAWQKAQERAPEASSGWDASFLRIRESAP